MVGATTFSRWVFAALLTTVVATASCGRSKRTENRARGGESGEGTAGESQSTGGSAGRTGGTGGGSGTGTTGGRGGTQGLGGSSSGGAGEAGISGSGGTGGTGEDLPFNLDLDVIHWVADKLNPERTFVRLDAWRDDCTNCRARTDAACVSWSDDDGEPCVCDPPAGECLERFAVERDGDVVDEADIVRGEATLVLNGLFETDGNTIVVEGCGTRVDFPLDTSVAPLPTVLETTLGAEDGGEAPFTIRWTSEPASALAYVSAGDAYTGYTCMFSSKEEGSFTIPVDTCPTYELSTFALVGEANTALGPTRWIVGQLVRGDIPNDLPWCN